MIVYVTRRCLTEGILELDIEFDEDGIGRCKEFPCECFWLSEKDMDKDTHKTRELAVNRANEVLQSKITSTEKRLAKLRGMSFE